MLMIKEATFISIDFKSFLSIVKKKSKVKHVRYSSMAAYTELYDKKVFFKQNNLLFYDIPSRLELVVRFSNTPILSDILNWGNDHYSIEFSDGSALSLQLV